MYFLLKASQERHKITRAQIRNDIFTNTNDTVVTTFQLTGLYSERSRV